MIYAFGFRMHNLIVGYLSHYSWKAPPPPNRAKPGHGVQLAYRDGINVYEWAVHTESGGQSHSIRYHWPPFLTSLSIQSSLHASVAMDQRSLTLPSVSSEGCRCKPLGLNNERYSMILLPGRMACSKPALSIHPFNIFTATGAAAKT